VQILIAGQRAFTPGADVALRVVRDGPPRLDLLCPGLPSPIADVVACALSKEPARRFGDARAMRAALDATRPGLAAATARDEIGASTVLNERTQQAATLAMTPSLETRAQSSPSAALSGPAHVTAALSGSAHARTRPLGVDGPEPQSVTSSASGY